MIPQNIADWAKRYVCGNTSETVEQQIKALLQSEANTMLVEAIQEVQQGMKAGGLGGRKFGHSKIANDELPLINERGFFLRGDNAWTYIPADYESTVQLCLKGSQGTVVIDHIDNLFYSDGEPFLFSNRSILKLTSGFYDEKTIWHAQKDRSESWRFVAGDEAYVEYWDNLGGTESKIRKDFILSGADISEMIRAFLSDEQFPTRFEAIPSFFGFHPEIAKEYLGTNWRDW